MQGNTNFEFKSAARKERNARPPRGEQDVERKPAQKRGKQWTRENDKREQAGFFNAFQ